jgi:hypothetical protein
LPIICALPGFAVGLLGYYRKIGPWTAVRSRLTATLLSGFACTVWLYVRTGGESTAYPPVPSSLAGSMATWVSLGVINLNLSLVSRQWLNRAFIDIGARIRASLIVSRV